MVLPPPNADDLQDRWINRIVGIFGLARKGVLILVPDAKPAQLLPLMRTLRRDVDPSARLVNQTDTLRGAKERELVVVAVREIDSEWLNHYRPIFEQNKLRTIIWSDEAVTPTLLAGAPDFSDWISHFIQCPFTVPGFTRRGLEIGSRWHPGIVWRGGLALDTVLDHLGHEHVEGPHEHEYPSWVEFFRDCEAEFVRVANLSSSVSLRRLRWALAQTRFSGTVILDQPKVETPGWFPVHADQRSVFEIDPQVLDEALVVELEPEAIELATLDASAALGHGRTELDAALVRAARDAADWETQLDAALRLQQPGPVVRELFSQGHDLRAHAQRLADREFGREELALLPGFAKRGIHHAVDELLVEGLSTDELTSVKVELELLRGSDRALAESYLLGELRNTDPSAWDYFSKFSGTESTLLQRLRPFELRAYVLARGTVLGWDALQVQRLAVDAIIRHPKPVELATAITEAATQQLGRETPALAELSLSLAAAIALHHELGAATPWLRTACAITEQDWDILAALDLLEGRVAQGLERLESLAAAETPPPRVAKLLALARRMMGAEPEAGERRQQTETQPRPVLEQTLRTYFEGRLRALERTEVSLPVKLRQALTRGELILCAGPELSTLAGLPSTQELADRLLAQSDTSSRPRRPGTEFSVEVEQELDGADIEMPELAYAISSLAPQLRAVYTTQLDTIVERAFAGRWPVYASGKADLARRTKAIVKLFGTVTSRPSWVLTPEQFEREFAPGGPRHALFTTAFRAHHMLFVGFEPDAEELERLLELAAVDDEGVPPSHFLITSSVTPDQREQLRRRGLSTIVGEPELLLRALAQTDPIRAHSGLSLIESVADGSCPYPGLGGFNEDSAGLFFGRHLEISEATQRLGETRSRRWLFIEGPSGVGKSSFVHAGVVPALREGFAEDVTGEWIVAKLRPGLRPIDNLAHALHQALPLADAGPPLDTEHGGPFAAWLRAHVPDDTAILIVVDQLEELVTTADLEQRDRFDTILAALLDAGLVYLATTVRADFVPAIQRELLELGARLNEHATRYALAPLSRQGLREAIIEPARRAGLELGIGLVEYIVDDAEQYAIRSRRDARRDGTFEAVDVLPLVAHILRRLWGVATEDLIELEHYRGFDGLGRALDASAEQVFTGLDAGEQHDAESLLRGLVAVHGGAPMARGLARNEAIALAGGGERGQRLLAKLTGQPDDSGSEPGFTLLRIDLDSREQRVDLTHDALLGGWERLRAWSAEERRQHLYDEELARRADIWVERGRPKRGLPRGDELSMLLRAQPGEAVQVEYQRVLSWSRMRRTLGIAALVLWFFATGAVIYGLRTNEERRARKAAQQALEEDREATQKVVRQQDFSLAVDQLRIRDYEARARISQSKQRASERLQDRIKQLQAQNDETITALTRDKNELLEEKQRTGRLSKKQKKKLEETSAKLRDATTAKDDLQRGLDAATKEKERLKKKVGKYKEEIEAFSKKIEDLEGSQDKLETALTETETALLSVRTELSDSQTSLTEAQTELAKAEAKRAKAEEQLTAKDSRIEQLEGEVESYIEEIAALRDQLEVLEAELAGDTTQQQP